MKAVDPADRVPFGRKLAMGTGSLASFFGFAGPERLAWPVFGMILGVQPWLIGIALLIPRLWDAVTDPLMGRISDNTRSRFGRRRPYILLGAFLMGLLFTLMWLVPAGWSDGAKITWFIAFQILFFTAYTIFAVPYNALSYELTPDYRERTSVMAYLGFFHKLGELLSGWAPAMMAFLSVGVFAYGVSSVSGEDASSEITMGGVHAVAILISVGAFFLCGSIPALFVKERFSAPKQGPEPVKIGQSVRAALSSRPFVVLVAVIVLNTMSGILASGIDQFVLVYYMYGGDEAAGLLQKAGLTTGYALVGFISIPVISLIASRLGKKGALLFVYGLMVFGSVAKWYLFRPETPSVMIPGWIFGQDGDLGVNAAVIIDPLLCGPMWVAVKIVLASMMADICDEDELKHGQRREGMFGAVFSWLEKLVVSLAALATGLALSASGFSEALGADQDPETFFRMRLFLAGAPGLTALLAIAALMFYPLDARRAAETRRQLEERRGEAPVQDKGSD